MLNERTRLLLKQGVLVIVQHQPENSRGQRVIRRLDVRELTLSCKHGRVCTAAAFCRCGEADHGTV